MKKKRSFFKKHPLVVLLLLTTVSYSVYHWQINESKIKEFTLVQNELRAEIAAKEAEIERLEYNYAYVQTDEAIAEIAREKLQLVKPFEILFKFKGLGNKGENNQ